MIRLKVLPASSARQQRPARTHGIGGLIERFLTNGVQRLSGAAAVGRRHDDLGALDVLLLGVAIPDNGLQPEAILERDSNADPCSHAPSMHCFASSANPLNASDSLACTAIRYATWGPS
jgi:hypothetical protein